jgi:hypothetical protein
MCAEQRAQPPETDITALRVRVASLEGELQARTTEVRVLRELADTLRSECDRWAAQAERLALAPPQPARRRWWPFRRAG